MSSLVYLNLEENPLISPPINICRRGKNHIFKYLYEKAINEDHKVILLQAKRNNRFYKSKHIESSPMDEFKFSNHFVANAIRIRMIDKGYVEYDALNKNIIKRRNAFRCLTKDDNLTYNSTSKNSAIPTSYQYRNKIEKEFGYLGKQNITSPETCEGERNGSNYCKKKFSSPPTWISKRAFNEHGIIQESHTSFCTTFSVVKAHFSHLCNLKRRNDYDDDSQADKVYAPKNQITILEYIFIVTLPISFLVLSIYILIQLIFNQKDK